MKNLNHCKVLSSPSFYAHGLQGKGYIELIVTSDEGNCITEEELNERREEFNECLLKIHNLGVKHGDLRLPNILINSKNEILIIDFWLSSIVEAGTCMDEYVQLQ